MSMFKTKSAIETNEKPIAHPAWKAVENPAANEFLVYQVVLKLLETAINIAMYPLTIEVNPPTRKEKVV